jgi:hypothetical protein
MRQRKEPAMSKDRRYYHTINISDLPEVVRLTEEARKARRPIRLTIDDRDAGVLVPPREAATITKSPTSSAHASRRRGSQLLAGFGAVIPTNRPENWAAIGEEVEQAIAREAMGQR